MAGQSAADRRLSPEPNGPDSHYGHRTLLPRGGGSAVPVALDLAERVRIPATRGDVERCASYAPHCGYQLAHHVNDIVERQHLGPRLDLAYASLQPAELPPSALKEVLSKQVVDESIAAPVGPARSCYRRSQAVACLVVEVIAAVDELEATGGADRKGVRRVVEREHVNPVACVAQCRVQEAQHPVQARRLREDATEKEHLLVVGRQASQRVEVHARIVAAAL